MGEREKEKRCKDAQAPHHSLAKNDLRIFMERLWRRADTVVNRNLETCKKAGEKELKEMSYVAVSHISHHDSETRLLDSGLLMVRYSGRCLSRTTNWRSLRIGVP
jgi:hypothetical protein